MKLIYLSVLLFAVLLTIDKKGTPDYWDDADVNGAKIYSIYFDNDNNGFARSEGNESFISTDSGKSWRLIEAVKQNIANIKFRTDIYCSVMNTFDGGKTWTPYHNIKPGHTCFVYLKDPNTGYLSAYEFLSRVSNSIFKCYRQGNLSLLTDHPSQCTEYYSNRDTGWAVGWCLKEFKVNNYGEL